MKHARFALAWLVTVPVVAQASAPIDVMPARYAITLAPDLARGTFDGREAIDVDVARPTARISLDAFGLAIVDARVVAGGASQEAVLETDTARQTLTLILPRALPPGPARIILGWSAPLEDDLVGFYRADAHGRHYALTHFEPANARRAFPCFDDPALKARLALAVVVDPHDDAISNAPVASVNKLPDGKKLVQFAETPPLPTYLFALAVGRFAAITRVVDGVNVRLLAAPEEVALGDFAVDAAARLLPRFASYFEAGYPFAKLDLVAVPALLPGGMENAGAIFLRNDRVLVTPQTASPTERRAAEQLVAHELAHQWLGDLVTPRWWDDLWLNEATATFVAGEVLGRAHPGRDPWLDAQQPIDDALADDELRATRPVRAPILDGPGARDAFDDMTYVKGAALFRMLDGWLGAGTTRRALAAYVHDKPYGTGDAEALFAALDTTAGRPASPVLHAWLERPGHPRIDVSARCHDGALAITLAQARAGTAAPEAAATWPIPVALRWPGSMRTMLLDTRSATTTIAGCPAWIEANAGRSGFYRVHYAAPLAASIAAAAERELDEPERVGLISDAWADVRTGTASPASFLALVTSLRGERSPAVMAELSRRLSFIDEELVPPETRARFADFISDELVTQYHALGFQARAADDDDTRVLRAQVIELLGRVGRLPDVIAWADRAALAYLAAPHSVDPTLAPVVLQLAAHHGDEAGFRQIVDRLKRAQSPAEQRRYLEALPAFDRPALLRRTLSLLLTSMVPPQDLIGLIMSLMAKGRSESVTAWDFFRGHFAAVGERAPRLGWLVAPAAQLCDGRSARQVTRFFGEAPHRPSALRRLQQTEEAIVACAALRRRAAAPLAAWLQSRRQAAR